MALISKMKTYFKQLVTDALNDRNNTLYQFFRLVGVRNATPFCSSLELNRLHLDYRDHSNADAASGVSHSLPINLKP
jgi:hypothetical protein